ncbi:MAG: EcsC family protein [Eubacteriales bacterium]|nr:EcsC family protein [Eubacteriales bacterium]
MDNTQFLAACEKELKYIQKCEQKLQKQAMVSDVSWKKALESVIPYKIYVNLRAAFATAFTIIFEKGVDVIEKTYNKESLIKDFEEQNHAVDKIKTQRELRRFRNKVSKSNRWKSIITTAEGVGLGALGIGLPDIVLFIGFLLQSVYEIALKYGYDYKKPEERVFILKMMSAAIQKREKWLEADMEVDELIKNLKIPDSDEIQEQIGITADAFALEMLVMKFIQGLPIVGVVGGLSNPVYYNKIMDYTRLKYHKRYLLEKKEEIK